MDRDAGSPRLGPAASGALAGRRHASNDVQPRDNMDVPYRAMTPDAPIANRIGAMLRHSNAITICLAHPAVRASVADRAPTTSTRADRWWGEATAAGAGAVRPGPGGPAGGTGTAHAARAAGGYEMICGGAADRRKTVAGPVAPHARTWNGRIAVCLRVRRGVAPPGRQV